jgi:hypothetical protein
VVHGREHPLLRAGQPLGDLRAPVAGAGAAAGAVRGRGLALSCWKACRRWWWSPPLRAGVRARRAAVPRGDPPHHRLLSSLPLLLLLLPWDAIGRRAEARA